MTRSCRFVLVRFLLDDSLFMIDDTDAKILLLLDSHINVFRIISL
jgi:hypothetical protein